MANPETQFEVIVDLGLYSHSSVLKATYKFTGGWFIDITKSGEEKLTVSFTPKRSDDQISSPRNEFLNELLDQRLREKIGEETRPVRNLIMAHALCKLELTHHFYGGNSTPTDRP